MSRPDHRTKLADFDPNSVELWATFIEGVASYRPNFKIHTRKGDAMNAYNNRARTTRGLYQFVGGRWNLVLKHG